MKTRGGKSRECECAWPKEDIQIIRLFGGDSGCIVAHSIYLLISSSFGAGNLTAGEYIQKYSDNEPLQKFL